MNGRPTCATCVYFHTFPHSKIGHCRIRSRKDWPQRDDFEWCGEHQDFPAYVSARIDPKQITPLSPRGESESVPPEPHG